VAGNADLQRKLNQGVEAAKAGNRSAARRLLEEVVEQDERNEVAWIWLATLATGASEKREHLRRVLAINPQNKLARDALARLGDEPAPERRPGVSFTPTLQETVRRTDALAGQPRRGNSAMIFVLAALALLLAGVGIILFGSGILSPAQPTPTATLFVAAEVTDSDSTPAPTDTPVPQPSTTPIPLDQITRSAPTLPPTPTATLTLTLTPTPQVTAALELGVFEVFFISQDPALPEPSMFSVMADGQGGGLIEDRVRDLTFAQDGVTFAFVRDVTGDSGAAGPEIFVSTIDDPGEITQVTRLGAADTGSPSFSPDGTRLVFSSSNNRPAPDLWVVGADGSDLVQLTNTAAGEREPAWSPTGSQIAFTSDQGTAGSTEIFLMTVTATGEALGAATQATNADRSSYSPSWSADGRKIVFASDRTGDGDLFTMDADGNNEQLLTIDDNDAEDRRPSFSPDGLWVIFTSNRQDANFQTYVARINGADVRRVTVNPRIDISARFRPRSLEE
jgi:dipeptidyl aminopeptidase/acylaminoacyl peptidase